MTTEYIPELISIPRAYPPDGAEAEAGSFLMTAIGNVCEEVVAAHTPGDDMKVVLTVNGVQISFASAMHEYFELLDREAARIAAKVVKERTTGRLRKAMDHIECQSRQLEWEIDQLMTGCGFPVETES